MNIFKKFNFLNLNNFKDYQIINFLQFGFRFPFQQQKANFVVYFFGTGTWCSWTEVETGYQISLRSP
jgi:hypothetical protein